MKQKRKTRHLGPVPSQRAERYQAGIRDTYSMDQRRKLVATAMVLLSVVGATLFFAGALVQSSLMMGVGVGMVGFAVVVARKEG